MPRLLLLLLKAAVSLLLLYLSLRAVNLAALGDRLSRIDPAWAAAALLALAAQVVIQAFRWRAIVAACGGHVSYPAALRISFIAMFFNAVLPSTVGGDAARVVMLKRTGGGWAVAAYSVLIDRVIGVTMLAVIVIGCLPWTLNLVTDPLARTILLLIGGGAIVGAVVFLAFGALRAPLIARFALTRHLAEVSRVTWQLCRDGRTVSAVAVASFAIQMITILVTWCLAQSVAAPASFLMLLFLIPPVLLIATVPVSIAGWGLREGSMIVAFAYAGLAQGDGLIVSVLFGLATFAIGIVGGILWIGSGLRLNALRSQTP
ncbi:MAG TPA: lysylphosphatidylglycerol synthase transmembrane domain-containing protein [Pseudolabrys sp.]|nr:lysylphosphatidylglycerol synthase transmembrane domain-containing protein [Pseudolabrys sp.]